MKAKFQYVGIRVRDLEKSIGFYSGLLGMQVVGRSKMHETKGEVVSLESEKGGFNLELNHYDNDSPYNTPYTPGEGLDHLAFKVDDLTKALEEAEASGHPTILCVGMESASVPSSRWAYIEDPDGNWIELW
ncbi:VOC family protein [Candidatus Bathyarchaeota archaeon]|nr:VOC family protein [Candidatus Bathyarchaeota archaeon]